MIMYEITVHRKSGMRRFVQVRDGQIRFAVSNVLASKFEYEKAVEVALRLRGELNSGDFVRIWLAASVPGVIRYPAPLELIAEYEV